MRFLKNTKVVVLLLSVSVRFAAMNGELLPIIYSGGMAAKNVATS